MSRIRIGILRGGPSAEHDVSLRSGEALLDALRRHHEHAYDTKDIFIGRDGSWHMEGRTVDPASAIRKIDVVLNALHGAYGEDGKIQHFFETHGVPFTGSGSLASAMGMNKVMAKEMFMRHGIKTPHSKEIPLQGINDYGHDIATELFQTFPLPMVVKPVGSGSSFGVTIVRTLREIEPALKKAAAFGGSVLVEEFISGREATCGVIEAFRGHPLYALPPVEIRPANDFFDYEAKYLGASEEIVPSTFSDREKLAIEDMTRAIHQTLNLRHYSRSDFIVHPKRGIFALEVNTLPGMTEASVMPKALRAVGSSLHEFADHVIRLALR